MTLLVIALSLLSATFIAFLSTSVEPVETRSTGRYVFVEDITATWCGYCPSVSEGLKDLSEERSDFRFITLIDDRVPDAASRIVEYNPSGFPTTIFDGGYDEKVGGVSSGDEFNENIDNCLDREVPDLEITVSAFDMGGSEIQVQVEIENAEAEDYSGTLKVHIVEKVSRYQDSDGNDYPNSLLGYAFDGTVNIGPGSSEIVSAAWVGADNEDLLGDDFGDLDPDNIVVYAVIFNSQNNYKKHPGLNANTYTAHYADVVGEAFPVEKGNAPEVEITTPGNGDDVSGEVEITAEVTSEEQIDLVEIKIGQDQWKEMDLLGSGYRYAWDSTDIRNGLVRISVRAYDDQGLSGIDNIEVDVQNEDSSTPPEISLITHEPVLPKEGESITIKLELYLYDTTISSAETAICIDGSCLAPRSMIEEDIDRFSLVIGPYDAGQEISYHVIVEDSDGNVLESQENIFVVKELDQVSDDDDQPSSDDDTSPEDSVKGDVRSDNDQTTMVVAVAMIVIVLVVVVVIVLAMGRKGKKEPEMHYGHSEHYLQDPHGYNHRQEEVLQAHEMELETVYVK
ncbi:MAG: Ig-like domain-containing protein [Candidatus Thermoplasmatota archaeon]|nr:Ig-like domain-containing protein [Candidatus Thermoplasmatota archaeon]